MAENWEPKLEIIRGWTNAELVAELRSPIRARCSQEVYVPLLVEAVARLLERKRVRGRAGVKGPARRR